MKKHKGMQTSHPIRSTALVNKFIAAVKDNCNPRDVMLVKTALNLLGRISDVCELKASDFIDKKGNCKKWCDFYESKKHNVRRVLLSPGFKEDLLKYINQYDLQPEDYLFMSLNNPYGATIVFLDPKNHSKRKYYQYTEDRKPTYKPTGKEYKIKEMAGHIERTRPHQVLKPIAELCNIPKFSAHSLRKTRGYLLWKEKHVKLETISALYGHKGALVTLKHYLCITQDEVDTAGALLSF